MHVCSTTPGTIGMDGFKCAIFDAFTLPRLLIYAYYELIDLDFAT